MEYSSARTIAMFLYTLRNLDLISEEDYHDKVDEITVRHLKAYDLKIRGQITNATKKQSKANKIT